jgi:hypothetical protein
MRIGIVIAALLLAAGSLELAAQSLAEVARQEAERRQQTVSGKQYTNADLREEPQPSSASSQPQPIAIPASQAAPAVPPSPAAAQATSPAPTSNVTSAPRGREKRDETYWRTRARELRSRMERLLEEIAALDSRVADLDAQRQAGAAATVGGEYDVAAAALARLRRDLQFLSEEVQRFEQGARQDNVPAEWIR